MTIDKLQIKQHFCHLTQNKLINREILDYLDKSNTSEEEIEFIYDYKSLFFDIMDLNSINDAEEIMVKLFFSDSIVTSVRKFVSKLIIP